MAKKRGGGDATFTVILLLMVFAWLQYGDGAAGSVASRGAAPKSTKPAATKPNPWLAKPGPASTDTARIRLTVGQARSELANIPEQKRLFSDSSYLRSEFGPRWKDMDGNGCNQRDDVLLRDVHRDKPYTAARQNRCTHDMLAGTWTDPYTGSVLTFANLKDSAQANALQIDHTVSLADAWRYGAKQWTPEKRLRFANWQPHLVPADGKGNMAKSDADPAAFRPKKPYQCAYAKTYIHTKYVWGLNMDASQKKALTEMLATCPS